MALTIGEANDVATLIHLLQGDTIPHGVPVTAPRAALAVEDLVPKVHKTLMAGPMYDERAVRRTTSALHLLPGLVEDLHAMVAAGAIYLETWPNARALLDAFAEVDA